MSKSKNYNRIVFLTTLSVYLGLVLVSGTAPVLAHSATTKDFDIHNEIEIKDDLDNKPDGDATEILSDDFPKILLEFLSEIKENAEAENVKLPLAENFRCSNYAEIFSQGYGSSSTGEPNNLLDSLCQKSVDDKFLPEALKSADYVGVYNEGNYVNSSKKAQVDIQNGKTGLLLKISASKLQPAQFAEFLNDKFSSSAKQAKDKLLKQIYENTNATTKNNQVFVITHLPRAALDEFLADKVAQ